MFVQRYHSPALYTLDNNNYGTVRTIGKLQGLKLSCIDTDGFIRRFLRVVDM